MIQAALDPSVAWYQLCDEVRAQSPGLTSANAVWIFPSLESALIELSSIFIDRERETGGVRQTIVYPKSQDPALEVMASIISASGLDLKQLSDADLNAPDTWLPSIKSKALFVLLLEDDRFFGRTLNCKAVIDLGLASGNRLPIIRVTFASLAFRKFAPKSFEICMNVSDDGSTIVVFGDRFRLSPKAAPYSMSIAVLPSLRADVSASVLDFADRTLVEGFEAQLPSNCRPVHLPGAERLLDRAIWIVANMDGAHLRDKILANCSRELPNQLKVIERGLSTLSGCWGANSEAPMADERRQEWLRARGTSADDIRGCMILSAKAISLGGLEKWKSILKQSTGL